MPAFRPCSLRLESAIGTPLPDMVGPCGVQAWRQYSGAACDHADEVEFQFAAPAGLLSPAAPADCPRAREFLGRMALACDDRVLNMIDFHWRQQSPSPFRFHDQASGSQWGIRPQGSLEAVIGILEGVQRRAARLDQALSPASPCTRPPRL